MFTTVAPFCLTLVMAQAAPETPAPQAPQAPAPQTEASVPAAEYRIGVDDALSIGVLQAPELNTTARVSEAGEISLPLLGIVRAVGLSAQDLELEIEAMLRAKYIRAPDVTVQVSEIRSRGVSVVGAVRRPGVLQIRGTTSLLEVLSLAGGLAEDAGDTLVLSRRPAEAPAAAPNGPSPALNQFEPASAVAADQHQSGTMLEMNLKSLMEARDAGLNVAVHPGDVVTVRSAEIVYVIGAIRKPGSFAMRGNDRLTVLRALALGEGVVPTASKGNAVVLRTGTGGERVEIPVDLDKILEGKMPDLALEAQDVLFVPHSGSKVVARVALDTMTRLLSFKLFP